HDNKVVRHFALSNLRRYGGASYESTFVKALGDANGANVRLALEALGESGGSGSLPAIRAFAEERKYRRYALEAVEAIEARSR
ncbi:MAG TPA: HEAT repeat domain-containing protein, partial [Deferrisomatales bacterium]|nr:HEAT repeat domain-containing protein [Deferrisomatales bacterium]